MAQFSHGFALLVGIADYQYVNTLPDTVLRDVQALSDLFTDAEACGYPKQQVRTLLNQEATADGLRAGLQWLAAKTGEDDTAVVYFSGHGGRVEINGQVQNYLIPYDATLGSLPKNAISSAEMTELLREIQAGRLVVLFDCCHAGGIGTPKTPSPASTYKTGLQEQVFEQLGKGNGRVIIASSKSNELSWIHDGMANSLFTAYLIEGLRGGASNEQFEVPVMDLFNYVAARVTTKEPRQHPLLKAELENNFPIALAFPPAILIEGDTEGIIPPEVRPIFNQLFKGYQKIRLKKQFSRGWSGATVFEVRPFREGKNSPELNSVIKFGPASLIQEEWNAYQTIVKNELPKMAHIMGEPIYDPDFRWGILRYPMVGDGIFDVQSLGQLFLTLAPDVLGQKIPAWLFPPLEKLWSDHQLHSEYSFKKGFAFWLPKDLDEDCSQLKQMAQAVMGSQVNLDEETIILPAEGIPLPHLPNPLLQLPKLLNQKKDVYVSRIHGDLNLENILVIRSESEYDVKLIDSARAREDYVLHDLLCLETGIWVNIMPQLLQTESKPFALLWQLLVHLHLMQNNQGITLQPLPDSLERPFTFLQVCRTKAYPNLAPIRKWEEYYQGLIIYLLGTLDFGSLDSSPSSPTPKQIAFWVAAIAQQLIQRPLSVTLKNPSPKSIPPDLYREIRNALGQCAPFHSNEKLFQLFSQPELFPFRDYLPQEHSPMDRVNAIMAYLGSKRLTSSQTNGLVILLQVLSDAYLNPAESLHFEIKALAQKLEAVTS